VSSEGISTLLRDRIPSRTIAYPTAAPPLNAALEDVFPLGSVALYFLYESSAQVTYYDPAKSTLERYPVLVVRRGLPEVMKPVLAGDLEDDPEARSILVFPVKVRLKQRVADALRKQGMRPLVRWFSAKSAPGTVQRPLVLLYDEPTSGIVAKFAEDWDGTPIERRYY